MASDSPVDAAMAISVCYAASPTEIFFEAVQVPSGATLAQGVACSRLKESFPALDVEDAPVGVFGKRKTWDAVLHSGDRVEIYRALLADPKETRRLRAQKKSRKTM